MTHKCLHRHLFRFIIRCMLKRLIILYALFLLIVLILADSGKSVYLFTILAHVPFGDKLGHFILIGMMSFLLTLATDTKVVTIRGISLWKGPFWLAVVITFEEFSQIWLDNRGFSLLDLAFDFLGILVFAKTASWLQIRAHSTSAKQSSS